MDYLIFVGYLVLFAWLVTKTKFFTASGLNHSQLVIIFLLKVMAGIFYGWLGVYYGNLSKTLDTWFYHYNSLQELELLKQHPQEYFTNLFHSPYKGGFLRFLASKNSWWNDFKGNIFIKLLSIFNLFSFGSYYVNVIFYSFLSMFGPVALYRVMRDVYLQKKLQLILSTFFIPSFLFWASGIHKEGLLFVGLGVMTFQLYFGFKENHFNWKRILAIFGCVLIILVLRNFILISLIAPVFAWIISQKWPKYGLIIFIGVHLFFGIFFFTSRYLFPNLNFPESVSLKQKDFMELSGGSVVHVRQLKPTIESFILNAPQAINLTMMRPYPSDVKNILAIPASAEIIILMILFVVFLFYKENNARSKLLIYFCIFFSISLLLSIGYTVNFLGAIVRYRSLAFPFLVIPMVCQINWQKINQLFSNNINNKNYLSKTQQ